MRHYGDITKINGAAVEPVNVITGGSPCQDLSVAGKRAGLAGERSGLFMEQIRIIKEMREHEIHCGRADESIRPRYMVWENVCGAFSSNGGEDFRAVLEETARVVTEDAVVPRPEKGKWSYAGCIMGDGWSIAWRTHDAQFWGVPQRRRRISLVADFGGYTAPEILFECGSLQGNPQESKRKEQVTAGCFNRCVASDNSGAIPLENHPNDSRMKICEDGKVQTLSSRMGTGGNNTPMILEPMLLENTQDHGTVNTSGRCTTLTARMGTGGNNIPMVKAIGENIIRKLTPLECERLQGYPDFYTSIGDWVDSNGKKRKDAESCRYRAIGNSIALPFWQWMAGRMVERLPENATMASLFDGIGGFPLVYSRVGVKPIWASEIEEFPIAVTKLRFPEEGEDHGTESNT